MSIFLRVMNMQYKNAEPDNLSVLNTFTLRKPRKFTLRVQPCFVHTVPSVLGNRSESSFGE